MAAMPAAFWAIASSSLVGTTKTLTWESAVEIMRGSLERTRLASLSKSMPYMSRLYSESWRTSVSFSPTPAVNVIASTRPSAIM